MLFGAEAGGGEVSGNEVDVGIASLEEPVEGGGDDASVRVELGHRRPSASNWAARGKSC